MPQRALSSGSSSPLFSPEWYASNTSKLPSGSLSFALSYASKTSKESSGSPSFGPSYASKTSKEPSGSPSFAPSYALKTSKQPSSSPSTVSLPAMSVMVMATGEITVDADVSCTSTGVTAVVSDAIKKKVPVCDNPGCCC